MLGVNRSIKAIKQTISNPKSILNYYRYYMGYVRKANGLPVCVSWNPVNATIIIESRCNGRCRMCKYNYGVSISRAEAIKNRFWLSTAQFKQVANVLINRGVVRLNICAIGEPFLNKHVIKMIEYVKKRRTVCSVLTNGSKPVSNKIEDIVASGLDTFATDMDSGDPDEYEYIKRGLKWNVLIDNLVRLDEERNQQKSDMKIHIDSIVAKSNYLNLKKVVDKCLELHVDLLQLGTLVPIEVGEKFASKDNVIEYSDVSIIKNIFRVIRYGKQKGLQITSSPIFDESCRHPILCRAPWRKLMVNLPHRKIPAKDWLGNVGMFCKLSDTDQGMSFGNILKQPFDEVWNGEKIKALRKRLRDHNAPQTCLDCSNYTYPR